MQKKNILVISNGHGEDIIASNLLEELISRELELSIKVMPVVGLGKAYKSLDVEILEPVQELPSGGFMRNSIANFYHDIKSGLINITFKQIKTLRKISNEVDFVIVVGDIYILFLAGLFIGKRLVFLPTAKSEYISGHYWIEKYLMKKYADFVFPRDEKTSNVLKNSGISSIFCGNAMMDCFSITGVDFDIDKGKTTIGILPGSRQEAYLNIIHILSIIEELERKSDDSYNYIVALASVLKFEDILNSLKKTNWHCKKPEKNLTDQGVALLLYSPSGSVLKFIYHHFGDVLEQADLFIGLAGTANEQAVGMGKPLVAFPGSGVQFTSSFARAQKLLLGDSITLVEKSPVIVADTLLEIIHNKNIYRKMSQAGHERMGKTGGIKAIVDFICNIINGGNILEKDK